MNPCTDERLMMRPRPRARMCGSTSFTMRMTPKTLMSKTTWASAAEESSVAEAQVVFDINVFGVMRMVKQVLPHMRARGRGRIINLSSVQGFIPAPYMAVYGASKHAIEGYSQSLDHEVRQYGIRAVLVEPAYTRTGFEANSTQPDTPLEVYAQQRQIFGRIMAAAVTDGDDPAVVAKVIVAAVTDPKPKLRYTAGTLA